MLVYKKGVFLYTEGGGRLLLRPRVRGGVDFLEFFRGIVGVDLRGGERRMAQHLLDGVEVGAFGEELGGDGVAHRRAAWPSCP